jgi:hypothetical protein
VACVQNYDHSTVVILSCVRFNCCWVDTSEYLATLRRFRCIQMLWLVLPVIRNFHRKSYGVCDFAVVIRNLLLCLDVVVGYAVAVAERRRPTACCYVLPAVVFICCGWLRSCCSLLLCTTFCCV